jgi:hypothetical protein
VDEASKLNLNGCGTATSTIFVNMLMNLPNMTNDIAASIWNWANPASQASSEGADSSYYLSLPDPYNCKHSPFETVEELLLIESVTPQLLYGDDANRNGVLDPNEFDSTLGVSGSSIEAGTGPVDGGWNTDVTVYSSNAGSSGGGSGGAGAGLSKGGRINVNTAQTPVLLCLPGLDQSDVNAMINYRNTSGANLTSPSWVAAAIGRTKAAAIAPYITTTSYQYSADIVAVSGDGRAYRRYLAVVNASVSPPAVLYWKDLTYLGWPLDPTILTSLRSGAGLTSTTTVVTGGSSE